MRLTMASAAMTPMPTTASQGRSVIAFHPIAPPM